MLCNLQELQDNLQSLLHQLSEIHHKLINPIQAKKSNTHSFLIKLPKIILLVRVIPYLNHDDLIQLSSTCVGIRKTIYSPIGWKIFSRIFTPYPIIIKQTIVSDVTQKTGFKPPEEDYFPVHMIEDEKMLKKARAECKKNLMQVYDRFKYKQEQYGELLHQLKSEQTHSKKLKMYKQYLEQKRDQLQSTNSEYKTQLKLTNEGFAEKVKKLDKINQELVKETSKLQNQKEALVGKIREYQNEIQSIKAQSEKSKQILKKIKNYLLYKQL